MRLFTKEKIKVLIEENDRSRFEYLLEQLQFIIRDIDHSPLELLPNVKQFYSFISVKKPSQFELLIEILNLNGFIIQTNDEKIQDILDKVNQKYLSDLAEYAATVDLKKGVNKTHPSLEKFITEGNYNELIKIAKDITYSPDTIKKAHAGVSRAVTNHFIKTIEKVAKYKISTDEAIKSLLVIATDNDLKILKQHELMLQAANVAFEICMKNNDAVTNLIKISNLKSVDTLVNLKAAAKFSEIALSNPEKYKEQIRVATKELNIRWLKNLIDPFRDKLTDEENEHIDKLIDYISNFFA